MRLRSSYLADDLVARKELSNFNCRGFEAIRPMGGVFADRKCEAFANGPFVGLRRIRGTENIAIFFDRVLPLKDLDDNTPRRHRFDHFAKEWPRLVNCVKGLRLLTRHEETLLRDDAKSRRLDQSVDRTGEIAARCVGLE